MRRGGIYLEGGGVGGWICEIVCMYGGEIRGGYLGIAVKHDCRCCGRSNGGGGFLQFYRLLLARRLNGSTLVEL